MTVQIRDLATGIRDPGPTAPLNQVSGMGPGSSLCYGRDDELENLMIVSFLCLC